MPIIDGLDSTRIIRDHEKSISSVLAPDAQAFDRVPIIAVSASLQEGLRDNYINIGFDGWILKPIDLKRLELLLQAVRDKEVRAELLDHNDNCPWEGGGWFGELREPDLSQRKELSQST